jgi:hypothetical protein
MNVVATGLRPVPSPLLWILSDGPQGRGYSDTSRERLENAPHCDTFAS